MAEIDVVGYLSNKYSQGEISKNPILLGIIEGNLNSISSRFNTGEIHGAYKELSLIFHPDVNQKKDKYEQEKLSRVFQEIHATYLSFEESSSGYLKAPTPYSIDVDYIPFDYNEEPMRVIKKYNVWDWATVSWRVKHTEGERKWDVKFTKLLHPAEIEEFLYAWEKNKLNPELSMSEYTLEYGFFDNEDSANIPGPPHTVSIKHLLQATNKFSKDFPMNKWIVVDKGLVWYLKGQKTAHNRFGVSPNREEDGMKHKFDEEIKVECIAGIKPSTVVMHVDDNFFVCKAPYHKYMLPYRDILVPTDRYSDATGSSLMMVEDSKLPVDERELDREVERKMMSCSEFHIPYVCLKPEDIEIIMQCLTEELPDNNVKFLGTT